MERLLFRLSKTEAGTQFVLKGGLIFYALGYQPRRPTRDIDFFGFTYFSIPHLIEIIRDACSYTLPEDGLSFESEDIQAEEIMIDADYPGIRVNFKVFLGKAAIPIQLDISFSDVITPSFGQITYPVLLDELEAPVLRSYPSESIISEKFQAMVRLAELNSRWKDFYDIWLLSESCDFDGEVLARAIEATFSQRETPLPAVVPVALTDHFASEHQQAWTAFLARNRLALESANSFGVILSRLRAFVLPPAEAAFERVSFRKNWSAGSGWR